MQTRTCNMCGTQYPATAKYFVRGKANKYGLQPLCKPCQREKSLNWRKKNRKAHAISRQRWARRQPPEYKVWCRMRQRCLHENDQSFEHYGGRDITVCVRWRESFEAFLADMGSRPSSKYELDRIDNDANYSCGKCSECKENGWSANCRWATRQQQCNNTRRNHMITINGVTKNLTEWSHEKGLNPKTVSERLRRYGWTPEEALGISPQRGKKPPSKRKKKL